MTRQEQIKQAGYAAYYDPYDPEGTAKQDAFEKGAEWADGHPRWISVEDELPAEQNRWILTYNGTSINLLMLAGNGGWYDHSVAKHRNITHWMRIEPPKKGGKQ